MEKNALFFLHGSIMDKVINNKTSIKYKPDVTGRDIQ